jgi:cephalosporin-C deacetylase-like acetyl esterase
MGPKKENALRMSAYSHSLLRRIVLLVACASFVISSRGDFVVEPDHADGIYKTGEAVHWHVKWDGEAPPATAKFVIKRGGLKQIDAGTISLADHDATVTAMLDQPEALLLEVSGPDSKKPALGGAIADPQKIPLSANRPEDFDAFWDAKVQELLKAPTNAALQNGDSGKEGVQYWKITLDNIRGTHVQGQLARPQTADKLPAMLIVQWAGIYPLHKDWAVPHAADGWLVLNINAHDLPIDEPEAFYKQQNDGPLKNYPAIGNDDRETSYFLRMYLGCYQAARYLTERPDWDGKTLIVMGASQGGMQTLVTASLFPKITAALAMVPAGCDDMGPSIGRKGGWPNWYDQVGGKDPAKVRQAGRYYDVANFVPRIKCPLLVGIGLIDEVCPPEGIFAAIDQVTSPKEIVLMRHSNHTETNQSQAAYNERCWKEWIPALRQGKAPAVRE